MLDSPTKLEKTQGNTRNEKMCSFYYKPMYLKECGHWNSMNPNKNLKDKKEVLVNDVCPQIARGMGDNHNKQGNRNQGGSIVYCCFICNFVEHNILEVALGSKPPMQETSHWN